jgi:hypothetical protein
MKFKKASSVQISIKLYFKEFNQYLGNYVCCKIKTWMKPPPLNLVKAKFNTGIQNSLIFSKKVDAKRLTQ